MNDSFTNTTSQCKYTAKYWK